jgi:hypothetical protein
VDESIRIALGGDINDNWKGVQELQ